MTGRFRLRHGDRLHRKDTPMLCASAAKRHAPRIPATFEVILADRVELGVRSLQLDDAILVGGQDLRALTRIAAAAKDNSDGGDGSPRRVLVHLEVFLRETARDALASAPFDERPHETGPVQYAGSPPGLASLIFDLFLLSIADGVVVVCADENTRRLLSSSALPMLARQGLPGASTTVTPPDCVLSC